MKRPLDGLRIAPFYGCYIVRPTKRLGFDEHPERDVYLEQLIEVLGAEPVDYAGARKCCGFPVITMNRTTSLRQAGRHLADAIDAGADCLVTPCPLCHLNLDMQQPARRALRRARPRRAGPAPPADGRARARPRAEGAGDGQARGLHRRRAAQGRRSSPPREAIGAQPAEPAASAKPGAISAISVAGRKTVRIRYPASHALLDSARDANRGFGTVRGSRRARPERPHRRGPEP